MASVQKDLSARNDRFWVVGVIGDPVVTLGKMTYHPLERAINGA